jgi:hypothetical protein
MGHSHKDGAWVAPLGREAQAIEVVGDELQTSKVNDFTKGETTVG